MAHSRGTDAVAVRCTVKTGYGAAGATTLRIQVTPN